MFRALAIAALGFLVSSFFISNADAISTRTWVARNGSGSVCTQTSPCADFATAYAATSEGGEINCVDSGDFFTETAAGPFTIQKSITIDCANNFASLTRTSSGMNIGGSGITVRLRNLHFRMTAANKSVGINFIDGAALIVENCSFEDITGGITSSVGTGVYFTPPGPAYLAVTDSVFIRNGTGTVGAGILIKPSGSGSARAIIDRVQVKNGTFGIAVDGSNSTGGINTTIRDSLAAGNVNDGVVATSAAGAAPIGVIVINSALVNNGYGIRSIGSNVTVRVEGSKIIGNGLGLSGGGPLLSGGGNTVQANATNGGFTGSYPQQ